MSFFFYYGNQHFCFPDTLRNIRLYYSAILVCSIICVQHSYSFSQRYGKLQIDLAKDLIFALDKFKSKFQGIAIFTMPQETSFAGRVEKGEASFFKYRLSDNRIGWFFAIERLAAKYPHNSVYVFSENRVIDGVVD